MAQRGWLGAVWMIMGVIVARVLSVRNFFKLFWLILLTQISLVLCDHPSTCMIHGYCCFYLQNVSCYPEYKRLPCKIFFCAGRKLLLSRFKCLINEDLINSAAGSAWLSPGESTQVSIRAFTHTSGRIGYIRSCLGHCLEQTNVPTWRTSAATSQIFNWEGDWKFSTSFQAGPLSPASLLSYLCRWLSILSWATQGINGSSALCVHTDTAQVSCYMTVITEE